LEIISYKYKFFQDFFLVQFQALEIITVNVNLEIITPNPKVCDWCNSNEEFEPEKASGHDRR
jgi:hypothetical protein